MNDPFSHFKEEVIAQLSTARTLYGEWRISRGEDSRQKLVDVLDGAKADIQELDESVRSVEADPARFNVARAELERRRDTVDLFKNQIDEMLEGISGTKSSPRLDESSREPPSAYEQQLQEQMYEEQDYQLDDVYKTVGTLRDQARTMGDELEDQAE
jgi:t-SNARE syntaxin family protein